MKHVPNGREERNTAREGTHEEKQPGLGNRTHEKERGQLQARKGSVNVLKRESLCPDRSGFDCSSNGEGCV